MIQCPKCQKNFNEYEQHGVCVELYNECLLCRITKTTVQEMREIDRARRTKLEAKKKPS
jgi:hypothetical protein